MPAATSTWFTSSMSSATKTAMKSNTTSNRLESDGGSKSSFMDTLQAASESTRSATEAQAATIEKPAAASKPDQAKTSAAQSQKKPARAEKRDSSKARKSGDSSQESTSADTTQNDQPQAEDASDAADTTAEKPTDSAADDIATETPVDTTLAMVQVEPQIQQTEELPASDETAQENLDADVEKAPKLHLPWRHFHEKPEIKNNQDESGQSDQQAAQDQATSINVEENASAQAPKEPVLKKPEDSAQTDSASATEMTQTPQAIQDDSQQQAEDSNQNDQNQQSPAHHAQASSKVSKPKAQTSPAPDAQETRAHADKNQKAENIVQSATQAAAATAAASEATPTHIEPAIKDALHQLDAASALVMDQSTQRDMQPQMQAAASARSAQQTAQDSPMETFDQIVLGLKSKIDPKNTKAEIHLNPPELGALKVSVSISDGQLTAEFTAQNQMVRDLLSNNMERLRNVLEGQGVSVDRLAVQTAPNGEVASSQSSSQQQESKNSFDSQHDGRSNGNMGQSQQRSPQRQNSGEFAAMLGQEKPLDMVA